MIYESALAVCEPDCRQNTTILLFYVMSSFDGLDGFSKTDHNNCNIGLGWDVDNRPDNSRHIENAICIRRQSFTNKSHRRIKLIEFCAIFHISKLKYVFRKIGTGLDCGTDGTDVGALYGELTEHNIAVIYLIAVDSDRNERAISLSLQELHPKLLASNSWSIDYNKVWFKTIANDL